MNKKKLIPRLRFPEFTEEWHQSFLSEFATINPKSKELPNKFYYIDLESVNNGILDKINLINKNEAPSRAKRLLIKEDILFQTVRPYQKNNYYFNKEETNFVASTGYAQIRTKNIAQFLFYFILTSKFVNDVLLRCTGTSYPAINSNDLKKININFPSLKEQEKIADFLSKIDEKIDLLNQKLDQMKQFKKGLMQQIFSQKIRFNGFTDELKTYSINNCIIESKLKNHKNENFPIISSTLNGIFLQSEYFDKEVASIDTSDYKIINKGFFTYRSMSDTGVFRFNIQNIFPKALVSPAYPVFNVNSFLNSKFFEYKLNYDINIKKQLLIFKEGGTRYALSISKFKKIKISIPSINEQEKIADFLSKVDEKINLIQTQLNQTEEFKKGLLQSMFI